MGYHNRTDEKRKRPNRKQASQNIQREKGPRGEVKARNYHLSEAFENYEMMKNNTINEINLNDIDKLTPYQVFLSTMFRMGRDTKALHAQGIRQHDMPTLKLQKLEGGTTEISYLAESNVWGKSEDNETLMYFNPPVLTGVLEFISKYDTEDMKHQCIEMVHSFEELKHMKGIRTNVGNSNTAAVKAA
jgi:hypothetical protein